MEIENKVAVARVCAGGGDLGNQWLGTGLGGRRDSSEDGHWLWLLVMDVHKCM